MPKINKVANLGQSAWKSVGYVLVMVTLGLGISSFDLLQPSVDTSTIEREVLKRTNAYRKSIRVNKLKRDERLDRIARKHAVDMAFGRRPFSHEGFKGRLKAAGKGLDRPYHFAENLYTCTYSSGFVAEIATRSWIKSPGHHRNLKGNFEYTGIGVAKARNGDHYVVQVFLHLK
ncbi:MAG: CAP domain-containing protein [Bacteroidota bacterium]